MQLEPIRLNGYPEPDRAAAEKETAAAVAANPAAYLSKYEADPRSFGGRFITADLIKETFELYAASNENRTRYNAPLHNSAAVLSSAQFAKIAAAAAGSASDTTAMFLTGSPGAGKTHSVLERGLFPAGTALIFEGQLANPITTISKLDIALGHGLRPVIVVAHTTPEIALTNSLKRYQEHGRGASINIISSIIAFTPPVLAAMHERYGQKIQLIIHDKRTEGQGAVLHGWQHLPTLLSEGSHEHIKQRLQTALDAKRAAGSITENAHIQALGRIPAAVTRSVDATS